MLFRQNVAFGYIRVARRSKTIESLKRNNPAMSANFIFRCLRRIRVWHCTCANAQGGGVEKDMELGLLGETNCICISASCIVIYRDEFIRTVEQNLIYMNGGSRQSLERQIMSGGDSCDQTLPQLVGPHFRLSKHVKAVA